MELVYLVLYVKYMHTFWRTWLGISRKFTSFVSFSLNCPGPESIALMVPEVRAWSRFTMNSCPSLEISFTYMASGPSQLPYTRDPDSPIASSPDILLLDVARSVFPESSALALPSGLFQTSATFFWPIFPEKIQRGSRD